MLACQAYLQDDNYLARVGWFRRFRNWCRWHRPDQIIRVLEKSSTLGFMGGNMLAIRAPLATGHPNAANGYDYYDDFDQDVNGRFRYDTGTGSFVPVQSGFIVYDNTNIVRIADGNDLMYVSRSSTTGNSGTHYGVLNLDASYVFGGETLSATSWELTASVNNSSNDHAADSLRVYIPNSPSTGWFGLGIYHNNNNTQIGRGASDRTTISGESGEWRYQRTSATICRARLLATDLTLLSDWANYPLSSGVNVSDTISRIRYRLNGTSIGNKHLGCMRYGLTQEGVLAD